MTVNPLTNSSKSNAAASHWRHWLHGAAAAAAMLLSMSSWAQTQAVGEAKAPRMGRNLPSDKALREMQIHKVKAIGLEVWVENQPPWEVQTVQNNGQSVFAVSSPENYHPPSAMTFASWPEHKVSQAQLENVAHSALRNAALNFGLDRGHTRTMEINAKQHGELTGYETQYVGKVQGMPADVRMFFGLQIGRAPVVLTVYTLKGKMQNLEDVIRRSWDNVSYLP